MGADDYIGEDGPKYGKLVFAMFGASVVAWAEGFGDFIYAWFDEFAIGVRDWARFNAEIVTSFSTAATDGLGDAWTDLSLAAAELGPPGVWLFIAEMLAVLWLFSAARSRMGGG